MIYQLWKNIGIPREIIKEENKVSWTILCGSRKWSTQILVWIISKRIEVWVGPCLFVLVNLPLTHSVQFFELCERVWRIPTFINLFILYSKIWTNLLSCYKAYNDKLLSDSLWKETCSSTFSLSLHSLGYHYQQYEIQASKETIHCQMNKAQKILAVTLLFLLWTLEFLLILLYSYLAQ